MAFVLSQIQSQAGPATVTPIIMPTIPDKRTGRDMVVSEVRATRRGMAIPENEIKASVDQMQEGSGIKNTDTSI